MLRMRLSTRAEHALHVLIELADAQAFVPAEQLAEEQAIPGRMLEMVMTDLRRAGLVQALRGPDGGFMLARSAADISLAEVAAALGAL
jgi:Rrf2 family protein